MTVYEIKEAVEIAKMMIEQYEKRGGGHSQKNALETLIACATEVVNQFLYPVQKITKRMKEGG